MNKYLVSNFKKRRANFNIEDDATFFFIVFASKYEAHCYYLLTNFMADFHYHPIYK